MCGRKDLLAVGERGTASNLDPLNENIYRGYFCLKVKK